MQRQGRFHTRLIQSGQHREKKSCFVLFIEYIASDFICLSKFPGNTRAKDEELKIMNKEKDERANAP